MYSIRGSAGASYQQFSVFREKTSDAAASSCELLV